MEIMDLQDECIKAQLKYTEQQQVYIVELEKDLKAQRTISITLGYLVILLVCGCLVLGSMV